VNTISPFLPQITATGAEPAHIVATSSMSGLVHGGPTGVYTTTKYAVVGMMEALRAELRQRNVGVSAFCPGFVQSRLFDQFRNRTGDHGGAGSVRERRHDRWTRVMSAGMDPLECGRKVLRGVRRNDMYILTHPEFRDGVSDRFRAVLRAFDAYDEPVPPARVAAEQVVLRHPVYSEGHQPALEPEKRG
jgi:short-subunit dehydrogenase